MALDYVARSYYWLPRVGGGLSGTYEGLAAGDWCTYITDPDGLTPGQALPPHYKPWPLPMWVPRKLFVTGFLVGYAGGEYGSAAPAINDIEMFVDTGGKMFHSAQGLEVGAAMTSMISLLCELTPMTWECFARELITPVLVDRDAGDRLCIEWAMGAGADWTVVGLKFLVPAPFQPQPEGPFY
jgi:hypothetical protein